MIFQLALIAVLALSQSLYAASDQAHPPEPNQSPQSKATKQSYDLNSPSQMPVSRLDTPVYAKEAKPSTAKSNAGPQKQPGQAGPTTLAHTWWYDSQWWMVIVAGLQFVASTVGIFFIWHTLNTTRDATKAAQTSAKAAQDSAKAAVDSLRRDRAWVSVSDAAVRPIEIGNPIYATVSFKNSGKTPALNLRIRLNVGWGAPSLNMEQMGLSREEEGRYVSVAPLGPDSACFSEGPSPDAVSLSVGNGVTTREQVIYVFGIAWYDDTCGTGVTHQTRFCYALEPSNWKLRAYSKYNGMT